MRPRKVLEAAKHLVKAGELFQKENIDVQENWLNNVDGTASSEHDDWEQFVNFSTSTNQIDVLHSSDGPIEPYNNTEQLISEPIIDLKIVMVMMDGAKYRTAHKVLQILSYKNQI